MSTPKKIPRKQLIDIIAKQELRIDELAADNVRMMDRHAARVHKSEDAIAALKQENTVLAERLHELALTGKTTAEMQGYASAYREAFHAINGSIEAIKSDDRFEHPDVRNCFGQNVGYRFEHSS